MGPSGVKLGVKFGVMWQLLTTSGNFLQLLEFFGNLCNFWQLGGGEGVLLGVVLKHTKVDFLISHCIGFNSDIPL